MTSFGELFRHIAENREWWTYDEFAAHAVCRIVRSVAGLKAQKTYSKHAVLPLKRRSVGLYAL